MSQKIVRSLIALLFVSILIFGIFQVVGFANRPLAEPLSLNTAPESMQTLPTATAEAKALDSSKKGTCGKTGSELILFIGTGVDGNVDNADAVRFVKVDYDLVKITMVVIPRDLWVNSGDPTIGENKLGPVYHIKKAGTNGSEKHKDTVATNLLAQILQDAFELTPDNYFSVDVLPWGEMVDTIGGVEVDLPAQFVTTDGTVLPAGRQLLNGEKSKDYVRMIAYGGDKGRVHRQNLYIKGLREKLLNLGIITKIPDLYKQFDKVITTDLTPKELVDLSCMVNTVPAEQIFTHEFTPDLITERADGALLPNTEKIIAFLKEALYLE